MPNDTLPRGYTPRELARVLRVGVSKILSWIRRGELAAVNVSALGRPRYVVLPHQLAEFAEKRRAGPTGAKTRRRRKPARYKDFYPD